MKRLLFILAAVMMTASVMAEGHMKFKGVEIDGSLTNFVKQMEAQGFTKTHMSNEMVEMRGMFAGETVEIGIITTPKSKKVESVMVLFNDDRDSWTALKSHYNNLKESLKNKYGKPIEVVEKFEYPYSESDYPIMAFQSEKATYKSIFETDKGRIFLAIFSYDFYTRVCIVYYDKINHNITKSEAEDDL